MDLFLGQWKLKKEVHFDNFLKFSGVPWIMRRISGHNKINLSIEKLNESYIKTVTSPFFNSEEIIKLDNQYREYDKSFKKFRIEENIVYTDIKYKPDIFWQEEVFIKDGFLITKYIWIKDNERKLAIHFFERR